MDGVVDPRAPVACKLAGDRIQSRGPAAHVAAKCGRGPGGAGRCVAAAPEDRQAEWHQVADQVAGQAGRRSAFLALDLPTGIAAGIAVVWIAIRQADQRAQAVKPFPALAIALELAGVRRLGQHAHGHLPDAAPDAVGGHPAVAGADVGIPGDQVGIRTAAHVETHIGIAPQDAAGLRRGRILAHQDPLGFLGHRAGRKVRRVGVLARNPVRHLADQ